MLKSTHRFLDSELPETPPDHALFTVIPAPMECTVSYGGGTAKGPDAILKASDQLELWDGHSIPAAAGILTADTVDVSGSPEEAIEHIEAAVAAVQEGIPVVLGGEHTVTLGALRALKKKYGAFGIVQFDAHADLRSSYEGTPYSHACVMRRATEDLHLPLVQLGVRALCLEEVEARRTLGVTAHDAQDIVPCGLKTNLFPDNFPEKIYLTFDVDGLDPSIMPATGTPVPGGLGWYQTLDLLRQIAAFRTIIGFDVTEFAPIPALHAFDFTAARLVYAIMGLISEKCSPDPAQADR
ncbi:MAG: agmatinase [Desulfovibrionaceae bacterium]|nr:agmatinase [Desulfovibrionaceae bacterium]